MVSPQIVTIARFSLLEAVRIRLPLLFIVAMGLILGAGYFIQQLAITESTRLQVGFCAAATRFAAVFVLSLHVMTSMVREFNEKGLELALSLDLPRSHFIIGRLCGFALIALLIASIALVPLLLVAPPAAALQWTLSLALELGIMAALSLFCVVSFTQLMPAAGFVFGFYLLARALTAIRMMSDTPLTGANTWSHQVISLLIDALALLLPALDHYAQSAWLTDNTGSWTLLAANALQAALYIALLGAAAMFDFYRRNL